jgi:hypothetical protein
MSSAPAPVGAADSCPITQRPFDILCSRSDQDRMLAHAAPGRGRSLTSVTIRTPNRWSADISVRRFVVDEHLCICRAMSACDASAVPARPLLRREMCRVLGSDGSVAGQRRRHRYGASVSRWPLSAATARQQVAGVGGERDSCEHGGRSGARAGAAVGGQRGPERLIGQQRPPRPPGQGRSGRERRADRQD